MMPLARIKKRKDFLRVAKHGESFFSRSIGVQIFNRTEDLGDSDNICKNIRVGLIASRKVGNAVKRNFVKRRMRALSQYYLQKLGSNGYDYVLIARTQTAEVTFENLTRDFLYVLKKADTSSTSQNNPK